MGDDRPRLSDDDLAALDDKDIAFQVWALLGDRSPSRTSAILRDDYGLEVDPRKISVWAGRYAWPIRARELLEDVAPTFIGTAAGTLVGGAPAAARFLVDASEGKPGATLDNGLVDRGRVVAAVAVLDRVGFLPHTRRDAERSGTPVRATSGDAWAALSDDDVSAVLDERLRDLARLSGS